MIEAKHSPPDYPTTRFFMELAVNLINEAVSNRNGSSSPIRKLGLRCGRSQSGSQSSRLPDLDRRRG